MHWLKAKLAPALSVDVNYFYIVADEDKISDFEFNSPPKSMEREMGIEDNLNGRVCGPYLANGRERGLIQYEHVHENALLEPVEDGYEDDADHHAYENGYG